MTQQKPFYEIEKPRPKELTIVARWVDATLDTGYCRSLVGNGLCNMEAAFTCAVCGQWTCSEHEAATTFNHEGQYWKMCKQCEQLSQFDRVQIYKFIQEMNSI